MKRYIAGLAQAQASQTEDLPDGVFLVRVERAQHRWHQQKPYLSLLFTVIEPKHRRATDSPVDSTAHQGLSGN
jgi:hypothetical protein